MTTPEQAASIRAVYAQVNAPAWAAENLDALADVLRDLSWLPEGPVPVRLPADERVVAVLRRTAAETARGPRPISPLEPL
ncbi:barstar family protein [uncultured Jatrophihabitans sp.]|uniref:barstar family protein n=1 Tax=uncultured Jatrophihabitans sp. TaxID=1610747 RepID=UPI0035CAE338